MTRIKKFNGKTKRKEREKKEKKYTKMIYIFQNYNLKNYFGSRKAQETTKKYLEMITCIIFRESWTFRH